MKKKTDEQLLERGRALYKQRHWTQCLEVYQELIANGMHVADGLYGIALVRLANKDLANARVQLLNCVQLRPNHANAHFYLGEIARMRGERKVAIARYRYALKVNSAHRGALQRMAGMKNSMPRPATQRGTARQTRSQTPVRRAGARVSRQGAPQPIQATPAELIVARIKALTFTGRESVGAYALNLIVRCAVAFAFAWIATQFFGSGLRHRSSAPFLFQWIFFSAVLIIPLILTVKTTVCTIRDGWVRIVAGIFRRNPIAIALYQLQSVTANQSALEKLIGDADLSVAYTNDTGQISTSVLRGLGKLTDLQTLAAQANSISNDLKGGAWRSGANYFWGPNGAIRPEVASFAAKSVRLSQHGPTTQRNQPIQQRRSV
jgi:tetratricopeptide (TPR) repeat protein